MHLHGSTAIVTGASRGIGAATAQALKRHGANVIALGLAEHGLHETAATIGVEPFVADVRDPDHARAVVAHALDRYGRLDVVVANAGIGHAGAFTDMDPVRIEDVLAINVRAPIMIARAAAPVMVERGTGALVFISSIAGSLPVPRESVYCASKAAIEAFVEPLREELRGTGVTVSTVVPTVVRTAFWDGRGEPYGRRFPRPLPAERVADAVVRALVRGRTREVVPRWLVVPMRLHGIAPRTFRALSRRFG